MGAVSEGRNAKLCVKVPDEMMHRCGHGMKTMMMMQMKRSDV
jgi:hypothetical protein